MIELIKWLYKNYPELVQDMREAGHAHFVQTPNPYHIEGDVWTHTMMVCKEAENCDKVVQVSALLHDIGKPYVRDVVEKDVKFHNMDDEEIIKKYSHLLNDFISFNQ